MPHELPDRLQQFNCWRAAWHIITCEYFRPTDRRLWSHVDLKHESLHFDRILAEGTWSSTEELMLRAAWSLFDYECQVNLYRLMNCLDDIQARVLHQAMDILAGRAPRW
jgi:hypothetical protein